MKAFLRKYERFLMVPFLSGAIAFVAFTNGRVDGFHMVVLATIGGVTVAYFTVIILHNVIALCKKVRIDFRCKVTCA